jgi:hypothetical protein
LHHRSLIQLVPFDEVFHIKTCDWTLNNGILQPDFLSIPRNQKLK